MRLTLILPVLALLAACGDEADPVADTQGSATGEVLEGTISDAMLPLATTRSQPPLADPEAAAADQRETASGPAAPLQPFDRSEEEANEPAGGDPAADPAGDEDAPPAP